MFLRTATLSEIYARQQSLFQLAMRASTACARTAHPETGGHAGLVHNWGNDQAKAVMTRAWSRWNRLGAVLKAAYDRREHELRHGADFRPMWCAHCQAAAAAPTQTADLFD